MTVTVNDATHESPIGKQGEFYLENLSPRTYQATIDDSGTVRRFPLTIPDSTEPILKLGEIHCGATTGGNP